MSTIVIVTTIVVAIGAILAQQSAAAKAEERRLREESERRREEERKAKEEQWVREQREEEDRKLREEEDRKRRYAEHRKRCEEEMRLQEVERERRREVARQAGIETHLTDMLSSAEFFVREVRRPDRIERLFQALMDNGEGANAMLLEGIIDHDPAVAYAAVRWAEERRIREAVPQLVSTLLSREMYIRKACAHALGLIVDKKALDPLSTTVLSSRQSPPRARGRQHDDGCTLAAKGVAA